MKKIVNWLLGSVLMIAAVTMLSSVSANASTYYHRTPTRATARKAYYTTDTKSHTFLMVIIIVGHSGPIMI
ncbi:hypothetical protein AMBR_LLDLPDMO_01184 [Lactiplantibacillus plantarum]|uniref:hypothetical protein n=1 Tax=Lactiplantibacillus plantarum TaxID=1590 RepID=UPI000ABBD353|nr:hypothetical protein [Lactiplantibacillus plantarum]MCZ2137764.1 hypothetical protein [Lactiplantibacillus plantarum]MCZ2274123.1 hypothetical protein [Lactiplantibacillus plantarum]VTU70421.1 hypothetical protein AMBR_LLDLPDMO_01184 [Lactiplantibacillus plantarum]